VSDTKTFVPALGIYCWAGRVTGRSSGALGARDGPVNTDNNASSQLRRVVSLIMCTRALGAWGQIQFGMLYQLRWYYGVFRGERREDFECAFCYGSFYV
jgi:hypothetical protein